MQSPTLAISTQSANSPEVFMLGPFKNIWLDEVGQDMAEYALLLALISIVVVLALNTLAPAISASFNNTASECI